MNSPSSSNPSAGTRRRERRPARRYDIGLPSIVLVVVGSAITAICFNVFLRATGLATGGIVGLSLLIKELTGLEPAYGQWLVNGAILLACAASLGRTFILKSLAGSVLIPLVVLATRHLPPLTDNLLLATVCGSAGVGIGLGLVFRAGASVGGFSAAAITLHRRFGIGVDHALIAMDAVVVVGAAFLFPAEQALCALVGVWITGRVARAVMTGLNRSRVAMIVSTRAAEIREMVLHKIPLGVTSLHGHGGYTGEQRDVLMIVMNPAESVQLKTLVREIDPQAFLILSDATEVLGRGFAPLR